MSLPVTCECVCTCGDPVPPKPVRRVMFSDDTCSCHDDQADNIKSLPVIPSATSPTTSSSSPTSCCCSPRDCGPGEVEGEGESCSAVPSNHYKSPHEVDGEYSYAYR